VGNDKAFSPREKERKFPRLGAVCALDWRGVQGFNARSWSANPHADACRRVREIIIQKLERPAAGRTFLRLIGRAGVDLHALIQTGGVQ